MCVCVCVCTRAFGFTRCNCTLDLALGLCFLLEEEGCVRSILSTDDLLGGTVCSMYIIALSGSVRLKVCGVCI